VKRRRRVKGANRRGPWLANAGVAGRAGGGRCHQARLVVGDSMRAPVPCLLKTRKTFAHIRWEGDYEVTARQADASQRRNGDKSMFPRVV